MIRLMSDEKRFFWDKKGKRVVWGGTEKMFFSPYDHSAVVTDLESNRSVAVLKQHLEQITPLEVLAYQAKES